MSTCKYNWKGLIPRSFIPKLVLYISRPISKFTVDLSQELVFIDRFHRIVPTKTYNFFAPTLVTSSSHKITAKCCILCPKTLLLPEKQLHAIHFFVATRNVCPLAIPESCAQNKGIRLLENHSFTKEKRTLKTLVLSREANTLPQCKSSCKE